MGVEGEEPKKVEQVEAAAKTPVEASAKDVADEKTVDALPPSPTPPPSAEEKAHDPHSKSLAIVDKVADSSEKSSKGSIDRDTVLARVETEKRNSLIKAWEESEKTKAENKAHKKLSNVGSWENTKKASMEAKLKTIEENLEKKKAEYAEKMKNKIAIIHKEAEEKRALVEAKRGEEILKAEEIAAKYRATGKGPKKLIGCFGG